jgi:ABC transporter DrrB family efflux protein
MTTVTAPLGVDSPQETSVATRVRWVISDARAVTVRNLRHWTRQPQLLVFSTIQPVMLVLLFRYVFGGAIAGLPPGVDYVNYLLPGIFVQAVAFGATQAAVGFADDLQGGIIDRFRSLPMARSAVLAGRTLSDLIRNTFVVLLMTVVGYLVGFNFQVGVLSSIAAIAMVVSFGYALSWIFSFIGLTAKGTETAQATGFVAIFPLVFASSAFVPIETMPGWLQAFAKAQPVTNVVNGARALAIGGPTARPVFYAVLWIVGILAVFVPLAVWRYRRSE